jgi:type I restriction enzyme R subunit
MINEPQVEAAALEWFGDLGNAIGHEPHLAPGEPATMRHSFSEVVLAGRLREAIRRLSRARPRDERAIVPKSATVRPESKLKP